MSSGEGARYYLPLRIFNPRHPEFAWNCGASPVDGCFDSPDHTRLESLNLQYRKASQTELDWVDALVSRSTNHTEAETGTDADLKLAADAMGYADFNWFPRATELRADGKFLLRVKASCDVETNPKARARTH